MRQKDQYLDRLNDEIEKLTKRLSEATTARDHYLRYGPGAKSPQNHLKLAKPTTSNDEMLRRKGLRSEGRARDLFEFFYRAEDGATFRGAVKATGYSPKDLKQFYYRYRELGLLELRGEKLFITPKGKELVDMSQPYTGSTKG